MKDIIKNLHPLGHPDILNKEGVWIDYLQDGFTGKDVPALLELMVDPVLLGKRYSDVNKDVGAEVWAPLHAWRIVGQLKSKEAIQPLINAFDSFAEDSWAISEFPEVMGMIGPSAIEPLVIYIKERDHTEYGYVMGVESLKTIAIEYPENRLDVIEAYRQYMLTPHVEKAAFNGLLMSYILDLEAAELIEEIRAMFEQDCVDIGIAGDLEEVEIGLGLRTERTTPRPHYGRLAGLVDEIESMSSMGHNSGTFIREEEKVGRNDPCPCGSGKKFKKCCL